MIDPASRFVDRPPLPSGDVWDVKVRGKPAVKADLVVLGDGYSLEEQDGFRADVQRATAALFAVEPFASRKKDFNVRAISTPTKHSGISRPRAGVFRETPLGARYNSFDSERYILTLDDQAWRDVAAAIDLHKARVAHQGRQASCLIERSERVMRTGDDE